MHTITVSIQGDVSVVESVQVADSEALPLFIRLKAILQSEETAKPARRRGRPRKEWPVEGAAGQEPFSQGTDATDSTEA